MRGGARWFFSWWPALPPPYTCHWSPLLMLVGVQPHYGYLLEVNLGNSLETNHRNKLVQPVPHHSFILSFI